MLEMLPTTQGAKRTLSWRFLSRKSVLSVGSFNDKFDGPAVSSGEWLPVNVIPPLITLKHTESYFCCKTTLRVYQEA